MHASTYVYLNIYIYIHTYHDHSLFCSGNFFLLLSISFVRGSHPICRGEVFARHSTARHGPLRNPMVFSRCFKIVMICQKRIISQKTCTNSLLIYPITIDNGTFIIFSSLIYLLKMVMFHSYVNVYGYSLPRCWPCFNTGPDGTIFIEVPERAIWEPQSRCKIETSMTPGSPGSWSQRGWKKISWANQVWKMLFG